MCMCVCVSDSTFPLMYATQFVFSLCCMSKSIIDLFRMRYNPMCVHAYLLEHLCIIAERGVFYTSKILKDLKDCVATDNGKTANNVIILAF